jgi:cytochrome c oxidase cbb3-type subunit 2
MLDLHKNLKNLVLLSFIGFATLSTIVAIIPAYQLEDVQPLPDQPKMTQDQRDGLDTYIANGCVTCHTQQVRNIEMDNMWGKRPSIPSDYYYSKQHLDFWRQSPSLLGSERTGPDLTNVGNRQAAQQWHLLHMYNPRIVVKESVMPAYPWMFEEIDSTMVTDNDVVVPVPKEFFDKPHLKIVARPEVLKLVAYLQSLKQTELPGTEAPKFIPSLKMEAQGTAATGTESGSQGTALDGEQLFSQTCAACHQQNGQGLPGAFPPLAGSDIVNDKDPKMMIEIILKGYDAKPNYGPMPPFGDQLSDEEIAAIMTHERSSWGNDAPAVTAEEVKQVREFVAQEASR